MKTVPSLLALSLLSLVAREVVPAPKVPPARLVDLYAVREDDSYVVHVLANGDISEFLSDRKRGEDSYRLTLDVPAVSPVASKFDLTTPFSRQFQVWPMQLGKRVYSRIEIELDLDASSVVGLENASHLFIRIRREAPPGATVASESPVSATPPDREDSVGTVPEETGNGGAHPPATASEAVENVETMEAEADPAVARIEVDDTEDDLFFSLFPAPLRKDQTLFHLEAMDEVESEEGPLGIRVGRFDVVPSADLSWLRGTNLLFQTEEPFVDSAIMARGRVTATLLDSAHELKLGYEARFRDFKEFTLEERLSHLIDVSSRLELTPLTSLELKNHYVNGSFEAQEFDFGGEVVASTDPFQRNSTEAVLDLELSERFGAEVRGSYNLVDFDPGHTEFFDYRTAGFGGALLYDLTPLTSLVGEYVHEVTPEPIERPEAGSVADLFLVGLRGELTPFLRGQVRAGFSSQRFALASVPQDYTGFVADASLTRDFGEVSALTAILGRRTNPSNFDLNGYYVSNYGRARFIAPFAQDFRITATGSLFFNDYPVAALDGTHRSDDVLSGAIGVAYFFTPLIYLSLDFRHDRRRSNLEVFEYRNNAVHLMVGFGLLNR